MTPSGRPGGGNHGSSFAGADKTNRSLLAPLERRLAPAILPRLPRWLETYHLTWLSLVWCVLIVAFSALARASLPWLWMVSLTIVLHYLTDHLDGKLGKFRGTGLVKWGYYLDHFLDYVFLCAVTIGYALILPDRSAFDLLLILAAFAGFMAHSFLMVATVGRFTISYAWLGPTEFRVALIVINALLIRFGTHAMQRALPYVAAGGTVMLAVIVWRAQQRIWKIDLPDR